MYRVQEVDMLTALYLLSPTGANALLSFLTIKHGNIHADTVHIVLARLVDGGKVKVQTVTGVTLWSLAGM